MDSLFGSSKRGNTPPRGMMSSKGADAFQTHSMESARSASPTASRSPRVPPRGYMNPGGSRSPSPSPSATQLGRSPAARSQAANNANLHLQDVPGDKYEGWIKHPNYGAKEMKLTVNRIQPKGPQPGTLQSQQSNAQILEPQIFAWAQDMNISKAFGNDGLKDLCAEVDRKGEVKGSVILQDSQGRNGGEGEFLLKKKREHFKTTTPDPLGLATLEFRREDKDDLLHEPAWKTYAMSKGIYEERPRRIPKGEFLLWYEERNNWYLNIDDMKDKQLDCLANYNGKIRMEMRDVEPQFDEKVANWLYNSTGGMYGLQFDPKDHQRAVEVVDLYEDKAFGSPANHNQGSWVMPGDPDVQHGGNELPASWERLYDQEIGKPYELPAGCGPHTPIPGKIFQGALDDFYFVQACVALKMKSKLVVDMFLGGALCSPLSGMFMLRLYKHGQWTSVMVDGFLPYNKDGDVMCCHHEDFPGVSWPSLAEKAYAKLMGSWMRLSDKGGDAEEVLVDFTGGTAGRFTATDVACDRMWKYFQFTKETTIWGCTIDNSECSKRNIPIEKHWASAIFDVRMHNGIPVVGVFTCAPYSSVKHFPLVDVGDHDYHVGYMWLRVDDFAQLFKDVIECRLVNSDLFPYDAPPGPGVQPISRAPPPPGRPNFGFAGKTNGHKGGPWFETLWGYRGDADKTNAPSFFLRVPDDTELIMDIGQECQRYEAGVKSKERRSDANRAMFRLTYDEYMLNMKQKFPGEFSTGQIADLWETLPVDVSDEQKAGSDGGGTGHFSRDPQAPLLLRFYQCSPDMIPKFAQAQQGHMPMAEVMHGEFHLVHTSAWAHTRDSMCVVKVRKAGLYMASATMPSQYSCRRLIFRTYSDRPIEVYNFKWPRNMIVSNPGYVLDAMPFSLTGFPRIDSPDDRLPKNFDEDEGMGKRFAGPAWAKGIVEWEHKHSSGGPKILGEFGGKDAIATQAAKETQSMGISQMMGSKGNLREVS